MGESISLQDVINTIRKRIGLIAVVTIMAIIIAALISYFVLSPVYESSTEILVNQNTEKTGQLTNENIQVNLQLIKTYTGILKNPVILDQVVNQLNLDMSSDQLSDTITISTAEQSQLITIIVEAENPEIAVEIANMTASIFENEIQELMNVNNITILSPAVLKENPVPVSPNPPLNMAIGAIVGLMLGLGIAFLLENFNAAKKQKE